MWNIKSAILFNRALLWMALAEISTLANASKSLVILQYLCAFLNLWNSFKAWEVDA